MSPRPRARGAAPRPSLRPPPPPPGSARSPTSGRWGPRGQRLLLEPPALGREILVRELAHPVVHLRLADRGERLALLALPAGPLRPVVVRRRRADRTEERRGDEQRRDQDDHEAEGE